MFSSKSFVTLAILLACGTIAVSARDCLKACTMEYNPVCATNGKEYRLLSNPCIMDIFNCEHDFKWTRAKSLDLCPEAVPFVEEQKNDCIKPCNKMYKPVCGTDGIEYRTFSNECVMENQHCYDNHKWRAASKSLCEKPQPFVQKECNKACPRIYAPVCATDGQTYHIFDNKCLMEADAECYAHNWHIAPLSVCENPIPLEIAPPTPKKDCLRPCPLNIDPVCATDGQTYHIFDNKCQMEVDAECYSHNWHIAPFSVCENPIPLAAAPKEEFVTPCPLIYAPVCATDGQTYHIFDNKCLMEADAKFHKINWHIAPMSVCENPIPLEAEPKKGCLKPCTRIYKPVCGTDGIEYKTFPNECVMENQHCYDNHVWRAASKSLCEKPQPFVQKECNKACPRIYAPVCATDGQTYHIFDNKCLMEADAECYAHNWHIAPLSVCENPIPLSVAPKKDCHKACTKIYAPVCATDGQTYHIFNNKCLMEEDIECNAHNWHIAPFSVCENPIPLTVEPKKDCFKPCQLNIDPVCATDGQTYHIFDNKCLMEADAECYAHNWHIAPFSVCENPIPLATAPEKKDCNMICTMDYRPVCAFDGKTQKTFPNECTLESQNCLNNEHFIALYNGECQESKIQPRFACPPTVDPVCGFDGFRYKKFQNPCHMAVYNMQHRFIQMDKVDFSFCRNL